MAKKKCILGVGRGWVEGDQLNQPLDHRNEPTVYANYAQCSCPVMNCHPFSEWDASTRAGPRCGDTNRWALVVGAWLRPWGGYTTKQSRPQTPSSAALIRPVGCAMTFRPTAVDMNISAANIRFPFTPATSFHPPNPSPFHRLPETTNSAPRQPLPGQQFRIANFIRTCTHVTTFSVQERHPFGGRGLSLSQIYVRHFIVDHFRSGHKDW